MEVSALREAQLVALLALVGASPAVADPPVQTSRPIAQVVQGRYPRFFDEDGRLVRIVAHIHETNTITNLATDKTITDEPKFNQIVHFNTDGTLFSVETMGPHATQHSGIAVVEWRRQRESDTCPRRPRNPANAPAHIARVG